MDDINTIRAVQGLPQLQGISLLQCDLRDPERCAVAVATGTVVGPGLGSELAETWTLAFPRGDHARAAAAALDVEHSDNTMEIAAPPAIRSFAIAASYGLIFADEHGFLRGWIEPTDLDPSTWDLYLMPGHAYPPGHEPQTTCPPVTTDPLELGGRPRELLDGQCFSRRLSSNNTA